MACAPGLPVRSGRQPQRLVRLAHVGLLAREERHWKSIADLLAAPGMGYDQPCSTGSRRPSIAIMSDSAEHPANSEPFPCTECQAGVMHLHFLTYFTWL